MLHLDHLNLESNAPAELLTRAAGRFYTGEPVGRQLSMGVALALSDTGVSPSQTLRIIDPFGGDGRLVAWLIEAAVARGVVPRNWDVQLWDLSDEGFEEANRRLTGLRAEGIDITFSFLRADAFREALARARDFDVVITNPPWELLKPDRRELEQLKAGASTGYIEALRTYDEWLSINYALSQPRRRFAGWGTNLSRVGLELSLRIARPGGLVGAVMPASLLADDQSTELRRHLLTHHRLLSVSYYPAEAKQYGIADVASTTLVAQAQTMPAETISIAAASSDLTMTESQMPLDPKDLAATDYVLPVAFGASAARLLKRLSSKLPTWADLETARHGGFWAGREIDETGSKDWLVDMQAGGTPFLKGRMIDRFSIRESPSKMVRKPNWRPGPSMAHERIAWRDVSRPSQKRRMIATIVPAGWALGNSLGVAYFADVDPRALRTLLGIISSTVFEFQLRANLATGHISLTSLRKVAIPSFASFASDHALHHLVNDALLGDITAQVRADAYVALRLYQLSHEEYRTILDLFPKLNNEEKSDYLRAYKELTHLPAAGSRSLPPPKR